MPSKRKMAVGAASSLIAISVLAILLQDNHVSTLLLDGLVIVVSTYALLGIYRMNKDHLLHCEGGMGFLLVYAIVMGVVALVRAKRTAMFWAIGKTVLLAIGAVVTRDLRTHGFFYETL